METKEKLLHLFWNCNLVQNVWFAVKICLVICGIALPSTIREITLGISESYIENQNTVNNILLILKCYRCRCKGEIPQLHGGLQYLQYFIKIEKNSTFYMSPKHGIMLTRQWRDTYIIVFVLVIYIVCMKTKYNLYIYTQRKKLSTPWYIKT